MPWAQLDLGYFGVKGRRGFHPVVWIGDLDAKGVPKKVEALCLTDLRSVDKGVPMRPWVGAKPKPKAVARRIVARERALREKGRRTAPKLCKRFVQVLRKVPGWLGEEGVK